MWIIRWAFIAAVIIVVLGFSLQNPQMVEVTLWTWHSGPVPLFLVVYLAFAAGMLAFLVVALFKQLQHAAEIRRYRQEIKRLKEELDRMRTISLDEDFDQEPSPAGGAATSDVK